MVNNFFKSFLKGAGRLLQLYPDPIDLSEINKHYKNKYESSAEAFKADVKAIQNDWDKVFEDINRI